MTFMKKIAAGTVTLGLAFTLAACSTTVDDATVTPQPNTSQEAVDEAPLTIEEIRIAKTDIAGSYSTFIGAVYEGRYAGIEDFYINHAEDGDLTEEEQAILLEEMRSVLPELAQLDVSGLNLDETQKFYDSVFEIALASTHETSATSIPDEEAITVSEDGKTGTIDLTKVSTTRIDGVPEDPNPEAGKVDVVLVDSTWLLIPSDELLNSAK